MLITLLGHFDVSWETNIAAHTPLQPSSLICFGRKLLDLCPSCFIFLSPRLELFNLFRAGRGPRRHLAPSCRYSLSTPTFHCLSFVLRHPVQIFQPDSADFSISKINSGSQASSISCQRETTLRAGDVSGELRALRAEQKTHFLGRLAET